MGDYIDMEIALYVKYLTKIAFTVKYMFTKPLGLVITIPSLTIMAKSTDVTQAIKFLILVYFIDFVTGIYASYTEAKEVKKSNNDFDNKIISKIKLIFDTISSEKLRKSVVKAITYLLLILLVFFVEKIFLIKAFQIVSISDKQWTITLVAASVCIVIEMYSIFIENLKRAGFDIISKVISIFTKYKKIKEKLEE